MKHQVKTNYECQRDALISIAERYADAVCGKEPPKISKGYQLVLDKRAWADKWNREYHSKMNELARGL